MIIVFFYGFHGFYKIRCVAAVVAAASVAALAYAPICIVRTDTMRVIKCEEWCKGVAMEHGCSSLI